MPKKVSPPAGWVKKETVMLMVFVSLVVGFIGGVAFSVYRGGSGPPSPDPATGQRETELAARAFALEEQIATRPDDPALYTELGNVYFDLHEPDKAVIAYERSLAIKPDDADVWTDLGVMYRRSGKPDKAIECFDKAVAIDPGHEISRLNKGIVLMHDFNDTEGALRAWEALLAVNPVAVAPNGQTVEEMVRRYREKADPGS